MDTPDLGLSQCLLRVAYKLPQVYGFNNSVLCCKTKKGKGSEHRIFPQKLAFFPLIQAVLPLCLLQLAGTSEKAATSHLAGVRENVVGLLWRVDGA